MAIYFDSADVSDIVWLERWSIRQFASGGQHLVGYHRKTRDGRVSSKLRELNCLTRTARTQSGRVYQLVGPCGWESNAEYVFNKVASVLGDGQPWTDVTAELIPNCRDRKAVTATREEVSLPATASLIFVSRPYSRALIAQGKLPVRTGGDGSQWIPAAAVQAYRTKTRAAQKRGVDGMMSATDCLGRYEDEVQSFPVRRNSDDDGNE